MRDILDKLTFIVESRGLGARKAGEVFEDPEGNQIKLVSVDFFPEGGGEFSTLEETQQAIDNVIQQLGIQPTESNWFRQSQTRAFGIAQFVGDNGPLAFIKYYKSVAADPTQNNWDNQTGIPGYRYASKAAKKTQSSATPQDILTQQEDLTNEDIVRQIAEKFPGSVLVTVAEHIARGGELPYTFPAPVEMDISAFQDYFCELLQPMALQTGQYEGEGQDAEERFLPDGGFANTLISFGATKTEGLSDSIMIDPSGRKLKISSKGGKGAPASAKNLLDAYEELKQGGADKKLLKKVEDTINVINKIVSAGQSGAPLQLGVDYGIISEEDAYFIQSIKKFGLIPLASFTNMDVNGKGPSKKLVNLAMNRTTTNPEQTNMYFHCLAAVAHKVADYINEHTNFGRDAAMILNNSALLQVYSKVTFQGKQWRLNKFNTKWPGSAVTTVAFDAGKNYYSTGIKGNFTFVVDPKKKDKADMKANSDLGAKEPKVDLAKSAEKIVNPKKSVLATRKKRNAEPASDVGRAKRKK
jgi:hypothetical protein